MFKRKTTSAQATTTAQSGSTSAAGSDPMSVVRSSLEGISPAEQAILAKSVDFEASLTESMRRSERRAWWVAGGALTSTVLVASSYIFVMPLKEKLPYLVVTDSYTGTATLSRIRDSLTEHEVSQREIIHKSHVARYVTARESYDWDLTGRRDWEVIQAMGTPQVSAAYAAQYTDTSGYNPDKLYGPSKVVRARIKSIVLSATGPNKSLGSATVRFDRAVISKMGNRIESVESFIATLAFEYVKNLKMPEHFLVENPLGFQVTSYRIDPDQTPDKAALTREVSETFQRLGVVESR